MPTLIRPNISTLCKYKDVEIIAGAVCIDHVQLGVVIPTKLSISNFMEYLKGKSTLIVYMTDIWNYKVDEIRHFGHVGIM